MLKRKGAVVFDADALVHRCYRDKKSGVYKKIGVCFPKALVGGVISRKKLGRIVFKDKNKLKILERIVHPLVIKELKKWIRQNKKKKRVYLAEVPLLFEKRLASYFDKVVLVKAKRQVLIKRAGKKYNLSQSEVVKRLSLYMPIIRKIKGSDYIVNNNFSLKQLNKEVDLLWEKIRKR